MIAPTPVPMDTMTENTPVDPTHNMPQTPRVQERLKITTVHLLPSEKIWRPVKWVICLEGSVV